MFGTLGPIPTDQYLQIYKEAGIDLDGRNQELQETVNMVEPYLKKMILYYKGLPRFQQLPCEDQIAMIKGQ